MIIQSEDPTVPSRLAEVFRERGNVVCMATGSSLSEAFKLGDLETKEVIKHARGLCQLNMRFKKADVLIVLGQQLLSTLHARDMRRCELFLRKARGDDKSCGGIRLVIVANSTDVATALTLARDDRDHLYASVIDRMDVVSSSLDTFLPSGKTHQKKEPTIKGAPLTKHPNPNPGGVLVEGQLDSWLGRPPRFNETITVTLGDRGENGKYMQIIGTSAQTGLSIAQLRGIQRRCEAAGCKCEWYDLSQLVDGPTPEAAVLVIRGGINALRQDGHTHAKIYREVQRMPKDKCGRKMNDDDEWELYNKKARHNSALATSTNPTAPSAPPQRSPL